MGRADRGHDLGQQAADRSCRWRSRSRSWRPATRLRLGRRLVCAGSTVCQHVVRTVPVGTQVTYVACTRMYRVVHTPEMYHVVHEPGDDGMSIPHVEEIRSRHLRVVGHVVGHVAGLRDVVDVGSVAALRGRAARSGDARGHRIDRRCPDDRAPRAPRGDDRVRTTARRCAIGCSRASPSETREPPCIEPVAQGVHVTWKSSFYGKPGEILGPLVRRSLHTQVFPTSCEPSPTPPRSATGSTVEIVDQRGRIVRQLMFDAPGTVRWEDAADPVIAGPAAAIVARSRSAST